MGKHGNDHNAFPCQVPFCYFGISLLIQSVCSPCRCEAEKDQLCTSDFEHQMLSTALSQAVLESKFCLTCVKEQQMTCIFFPFICKGFKKNPKDITILMSLLNYRSVYSILP